jgi:hypothetical protein
MTHMTIQLIKGVISCYITTDGELIAIMLYPFVTSTAKKLCPLADPLLHPDSNDAQPSCTEQAGRADRFHGLQKSTHTCKGGVFKRHNKTRHLELLRTTGQLVKTSFLLDQRKKSV